jgi:2-dehydropantoate 2-reductase
MGKRIAVLGTGAIGSSVGADLTRAGYDAVLIDQWPAHVEAMKSKGVRISMPDEELHSEPTVGHHSPDSQIL